MKATVTNENGQIEIELTPEQIATVQAQLIDYKTLYTYEKAFAYLGMNYDEWLEAQKGRELHSIAYDRLTILVKALNGGKHVTKGYYPVFNSKGSSGGFSFVDFNFGSTVSVVGSRLLYVNEERAKFATKVFINAYDEHIN